MFRLTRFWAPLLVVAANATPALAQSAADKSTARRLATEGIELFGDAKYEQALDRLQRAQALYDAPVHLLYIARAQAKLKHLVESAETYRRLIRVELPANSPAAFRDAIEAGKREVSEVEARIGSLRVDVDPPNPQGLQLTIDGQEVSAAIVGIERPVNPGRHTIRATAPGYSAAEATIELDEDEKKSVRLVLPPDPRAARAERSPAADGKAPTGASREVGGHASTMDTTRGVSERDDDIKAFNLVFGLRLGAALPGGSLYKEGDTEVATSDYLKTGATAELHAGAWFAGYFGAKLYLEAYSFAPGPALDRLEEFDVGAKVENQASGQGIGLAVMAGTPLRRWGAFGELGLTFLQEYSITREFTADEGVCGSRFKQTLSFSGAAFRVGGGVRIPVSKLVQITPYVLASVGAIGEVENESDCALVAESSSWPPSGELSESVGNRMIVFGIGGDLLFGLGGRSR